ncbi:phage late control D family protein [Alicyclobacillus fastidiosus]|uniref:Phage protein D n=1 Tax=Alicyclobacillus fastidiosus TaxID=392011 RepID=A0ABV5AKV6_9BACL|nr:hypothetical protein [Alicyclobacillus fastidiosus]WEH08180.1 hypothetical protein PYS47_15855 [Alicyclobacillus fastidiosus]
MGEPRCLVEVAGRIVLPNDIYECDVDLTLYMAASSFDITINNSDLKSDWFQKKQQVKVYYGYVNNPDNWNINDLDHVFTGLTDGVKPQWGGQQGDVVELIGRDYSGQMIDTYNSYAFTNWTSSQIANYFAKKYGLTPIITATTSKVPSDAYQNLQEWDVLQTCAVREGFICYVTKDLGLYFGPRQYSSNPVATISVASISGAATSGDSLVFDDSAVGVYNKVTVIHYYKGKTIEGSAQNDKLIQSMGGQVVEKIMTDSKATTPALANQLAQSYLTEYSRQAITGTLQNLPGNTAYTIDALVKVTGAGRFSGSYYIEEAKLQYGKQNGFVTESLSITNILPDYAYQYKTDLYGDNGETNIESELDDEWEAS